MDLETEVVVVVDLGSEGALPAVGLVEVEAAEGLVEVEHGVARVPPDLGAPDSLATALLIGLVQPMPANLLEL